MTVPDRQPLRPSCTWAIVAGLWLAGAPGAVHAQAKTALHWVRGDGAEDCIGPPQLATAVERHVGPVLVAPSEGEVNVEGRIDRTRHGFVAHILVSGRDGRILGERTLEGAGSDCRALDADITFVIAVAIDPDAVLAELPGELAPNEQSDPGADLLQDLRDEPPAPARAPRDAPAPDRRKRPRPRARRPDTPVSWLLAAGLGVGVGTLEQVLSAGARLSFAVAIGEASLLLDTGLWLPETQSLPANTSASVTLSRADLGLSACPVSLRMGPVTMQPCAGVIGSRLSASPSGFMGQAAARLVLGPRLSFRTFVPLGSGFEAHAQLDIFRQWPQHAFTYGRAGIETTVYEVADLSGCLSIGIGMRF